MDKFTLFWKNGSPFTNWYPSPFTIDGIQFSCGEQAMMYTKAFVFEDDESCIKILETSSPKEHKALGRGVLNYNDAKWSRIRYQCVVKILKQKFGQNPRLLKILLDTGDSIIAEASPYDLVWGIGWEESHPNATIPEKWRGQNLLGKSLMETRAYYAGL